MLPPKQNREVPLEHIVFVDGRFRFSNFFISSTRGYGQLHVEHVFYSLLLEGLLTKLYQCKRTSEESGTIGGRKEKEFVDDDLTTGKHPTI